MRQTDAMISADLDGDFDVDGADLLLWQRGYGSTGQTGNENGNADGNGVVDGHDLSGWQTPESSHGTLFSNKHALRMCFSFSRTKDLCTRAITRERTDSMAQLLFDISW